MPEVSKTRAFLVFLFVVFSLVGSSLLATDPSNPVVTKVLIEDDSYREIANTGTLNAVNRIFYSSNMPSSVKAHPMTEIFLGAAGAGMLVRTSIVEGDWFFALDSSTGDPVTIQFHANDFALPGGTARFSQWSIPPG